MSSTSCELKDQCRWRLGKTLRRQEDFTLRGDTASQVEDWYERLYPPWSDLEQEIILDTPSRTLRSNEGFKPARTAPRPGGRAPSERETLPKSNTGEVISSLFTYNPAAKAPRPAAAIEDDTPVEPSNAPLTDELATFTNFGLSTRLASHLLNKLEKIGRAHV